MPSKGIIVVHSDEDEDLKDSVMEHLGVLETVTKVEAKTIESLNRLGTVALKNKLKGREALVLLLSAPVLSSKFLRQQVVQDMAEADSLLAVAGRPCAWRIVPWLNESLTWPKSGYVIDAEGAQLDRDLTELTYILAAKTTGGISELAEEEIAASISPEILGDDSSEERENTALEDEAEEAETPDLPQPLMTEIAAGPAQDDIPPHGSLDEADTTKDSKSTEVVQDDLCRQFDDTCLSVLPSGQKLDDDVLGALLELGLILGSTKEDDGDDAGAKKVYLHAARKLIDLINGGLVDGQPISRFVRSVRLSMWRSLKEAENEVADLEVLRASFEEILASVSNS